MCAYFGILKRCALRISNLNVSIKAVEDTHKGTETMGNIVVKDTLDGGVAPFSFAQKW